MHSAATEHIRLRGEIARVFYSSANFSAGRFVTDRGDSIQFAGNIVAPERQPLILYGRFVKHPKYGSQFEALSMEYDQDLDTRGLASYLANHPDIKGIGPAKARIIAERFGRDFERALAEEPEAIAQAAKVPVDTIYALRDRWTETRAVNAAMTSLSAYGLTHHQVKTLIRRLGNNAVGVLQRDPYVIVREIPGFGFKRVDKIARQVGVPKDEPGRIRAGIVFCIEEALDQGDCWVEYEELLSRANKLLVMDCLDSRERIETCLDGLIDEGELICYSADSRFLVARPQILSMEQDLAGIFQSAARPNPHFTASADLERDTHRSSPKLSPEQLRAVVMALGHSISLISGGAGSGKTFTMAALTRFCESRGLSVVLCAPTGKAAKRMEEATGHGAFTIHRLLGFNGKAYALDAESPVDADVLIVDEMSMVDVPLAWHLFQAIDLSKTAVVLVGDHNQLPPVGPGNVLRDLIQSSAVPKVILDTVVRQAGILKENSTAILAGEVRKSPTTSGTRGAWYVADQYTDAEHVQAFILALFDQVLNQKLGFDLLRDVQVLTPTHKGPLGTVELNARLQRLLQRKLWGYDVPPPIGKRPKLLVNDKVIQTRNNYELGVMNGTVGIVREVEPDGSLAVEFQHGIVCVDARSPSRNDLQLAYALTIHRCQGSEFPCSVVVMHKSHSFMHHRNLLYTGLTRASQTAIIVGDHWGITNCAKRMQVDARKTFLSLLLPGGIQNE